MHATDFADKVPDTATERELAKQLRTLPDDERFAFVLEMVNVDLVVALRLANACLQQREQFQRLLEHGLARVKDLSAVDLWLNAVMPRLGVPRVLAVLREQLDAHPFAVGSALYFLQGYVKKEDTAAVAAFRELYEAASQKGGRLPDLRGFFQSAGDSRPCPPHQRGDAPPVLCPRCTAVLSPWREGIQQQTCSHCGERISR